MVSTLVEERFIDLLNEYAEAETKSEITRQVLFERRDYDSYSLYKRVLDGDIGGISRPALRAFLNDCNLFPLETDLDLLFWNLDKDGDGLLSWSEFLAVVLPKEHATITPQYGGIRAFSLEAEHSLMRVFEQELLNQRNLEDSRKSLHLSSYTESTLFDLVDRDLNGWVSLADLEAFLKSRFAGSTFLKTERSFRRVDEDNDGRINFEEFLRAVRPVYLYPTYVDYYNTRRASSPLRYKSILEEKRYLTPEKVRESMHRSRLLRTSYLSPRRFSPVRYSPARKTLAAELRDDRINRSIERSVRRSLRRSTYLSPLREAERERALIRTGILSPRREVERERALIRTSLLSPRREVERERALIRSTLLSPRREVERERALIRTSLLSPRREVERERALLRSSYLSPARELERALSAAKIRNDVRLRALDRENRRWSPIRGWVYHSPVRESILRERTKELERDRLRESLSRSRVRESLMLERSVSRSRLRDSLMLEKKGSAYNSTAAKTYKSWYDNTRDKRELSPVNQRSMIVNLKDSIFDNKVLEEKRTNLAMRYDFALTDMFSMADYDRTGVVTLENLRRFSFDNSLALDNEDLCIIIDRFDKDRDGMLSFSEFSDLWLPRAHEYRRMMQERLGRSVNQYFEFTTLTQSHIRDLLRSVVTVEENFECNKFRLTDGRYLSADEIFAFLDKWKTGSVTLTEFTQSLEDAGIYCTAQDSKTLFEQFDKNKDGRITFEEFHSPVRNRYY